MTRDTIERPNGRLYRPRAEPRAVLLGDEDDDPTQVVVLGTHDVHEAQGIAEREVDEYVSNFYGTGAAASFTVEIHDPEQTWIRDTPLDSDGRRMYVTDLERGRAAVRWNLTWSEA